MFWNLDSHPYPACNCSGRDLLCFFGILAECQRSARQYAILERTGLWNYNRCYCDFLVAPCYLLSLETLRDAPGKLPAVCCINCKAFREKLSAIIKILVSCSCGPCKVKERSFAPSLFLFCHSLLSLLFVSLALLSSFFSGLLS